jgi:RNA polymerase sigma factor (sigma-70 family)
MQRPLSGRSGEDRFLSNLDLIERIVAHVIWKHHLSAVEGEDFGSFVKLRLIENDYAILDKFEGRSSLRTFLTTVVQRLYLDHRIKAFGKWRPSAEARRAGSIGVLLERLLVRDGHPFEEAWELLRTNHRVEASRSDLERLAAQFPPRARRRFEPDDSLDDLPAADESAEEAVAESERREGASRLSRVLRDVMARLDVQDRLILALRFKDGRSVADIAAMLRLDQKPLYRRVKRVMEELRDALVAAGMGADVVRDLLQSPAVSVDWSVRAETPPPRPSIAKGGREWR